MKTFYSLFIILFISYLSFAQMINEFEPNPVGGDPSMVNVELKGTPNADFSGYILGVESDSGGPEQGLVDRYTAVSGTFDANGLLLVSIPDLENPSFTLVLVSDFTGDKSTDIDANDDGTVDDTSTFGTIYDAIGIPDTTGEPLYGMQLGGADFAYTGDEPGLVFRDGSTNYWYAVNEPSVTDVYDINANSIAGSSFDTNPTGNGTLYTTSFGSINPINNSLSKVENSIKGFIIYPNPSSEGYINIHSRFNTQMEVTLFDVVGKQVLSSSVKDNILDVSELKSGLYILQATQEGASTTKKLVIE